MWHKVVLIDRKGEKAKDFRGNQPGNFECRLTDSGEHYQVIKWDSRVFLFQEDRGELAVYKECNSSIKLFW